MKISPLTLKKFKKPLRYVGNEFNVANKSFEQSEVRFCLIFPDLYEIGMSHLGLKILYHIINSQENLMADRAFCPDTDFEKYLRDEKIPLYALESKEPLQNFDCLAFTLPYELCYVNILTILSLCNIPFLAKDREEGGYPLIIGGGSAAIQPEPIAPFFDAILIGDGEKAILEIADEINNAKRLGLKKRELLENLAKIQGIYVPSFFRESIVDDFIIPEPIYPTYTKVIRRIEPDLNTLPFPTKTITPILNITHDRFGVEISRGCTRGCRFCQAGVMYRPVRERMPNEVINISKEGIKNSGWEELSFLSLSTGDYGCLTQITGELIDYFYPKRVSVSLPSLRVGSINDEILTHIKKVRKTGFTIAPEAGSERLRRVINKDITEEALIDTVKKVCENGWKGIKLYFMLGLPTEDESDVQEIINLVNKLRHLTKHKNITITASVGLFVPKAHTPFQWEGQLDENEAKKRLDKLKDGLKSRNIQLKWQDTRMSVMECIFSRGDRSLAQVIIKAWEKGARLDSWSDYFNPLYYYESSEDLGINLMKFIKEFDINRPLPWGHIDVGIKREFLLKEREKAFRGEITKDCRWGNCLGCGVCDFKEIKPICFSNESEIKQENSGEINNPQSVIQLNDINDISPKNPKNQQNIKTKEVTPLYYLVEYAKMHYASLIGHLDLMRLFQRAATRAGLPLSYSKGFNPSPLMSFDQPIPLGVNSICEQFSMGLEEFVEPQVIIERLNENLIDGLSVSDVQFTQKKTLKKWNKLCYTVSFDNELRDYIRNKISYFNENSSKFFIDIKDEKGNIQTISLNKKIDIYEIESSMSEFCNVIIDLYTFDNRNPIKIDSIVEMLFGVRDCNITLIIKSYL